ncbi:MAG TPA: biosynthetic arginine decarboxylase [Planctomycetota bacterium]|nr:biosynthetic arginine decarboxylase [Planctomycetota bacterium]
MNETEILPDPYLISSWGSGYFSTDADGFVRMSPAPDSTDSIRLADVVEALRKKGLRSPFLIRFPQILKNRVEQLNAAFNAAIKQFDYPERYQGVYPVKVNQQRVVVEALVEESGRHHYGLEVGSKGELVLALTQHLDEEALIICNGFKDRDYVELALRANVSGHQVLLICETIHEVQEILDVGTHVGCRPRIGFRARLHSQGAGKWVESGGSHAKFGLSTLEILECIRLLESAGATDALECLHFHIGSQISDILSIKEAVKEAARIYCHVRRRAPRLLYFDMGGGLGVDYDGSSTASDWSRNYTLEEYCRDCVYNVMSVCEQEGTPPPRLVTESGRAVTAFGSMVAVTPLKVIGRIGTTEVPMDAESCHQVKELASTLEDMRKENWREAVNDARSLHDEVTVGFKMGFLSLEDRAAGEALFSDICRKALSLLDPQDEDESEVASLMTTVAPMVVCNFSVFQSTPDTWAVRQVFPIMPLSRVYDEKAMPYTLGDITCDSDGRIDDFLHESGATSQTIMLPPLDLEQPYHLGIFLVGAYQDTLGDFHNLFGSANEASIVVDGMDKFTVVSHHRGTNVAEATVLFGYDRQTLVTRFDDMIGSDETAEALRYRDCFLRVLSSGTYLRR